MTVPYQEILQAESYWPRLEVAIQGNQNLHWVHFGGPFQVPPLWRPKSTRVIDFSYSQESSTSFIKVVNHLVPDTTEPGHLGYLQGPDLAPHVTPFERLEKFRVPHFQIPLDTLQHLIGTSLQNRCLQEVCIAVPDGMRCAEFAAKYSWLQRRSCIRALGLSNFDNDRHVIPGEPRPELDQLGQLVDFARGFPNLEAIELIPRPDLDEPHFVSLVARLAMATNVKTIYQSYISGARGDQLRDLGREYGVDILTLTAKPQKWPI
jgi:hypothetical protein